MGTMGIFRYGFYAPWGTVADDHDGPDCFHSVAHLFMPDNIQKQAPSGK